MAPHHDGRPHRVESQSNLAVSLAGSLDAAEARIRSGHAKLAAGGPRPALLVGISGIDASGKGFVTARLAERLERRGLRAANLNVDGWLNLPSVRFGGPDPGRGFYEHALRLDEMFARLVLPLRERRSVELEMDYAEETATAYRRHRYVLRDIDIILVEGVFIFRRAYRHLFDLRIWVECSFETALQRALARGQEGLPAAETIRAYETIYFPAQRIHAAADDPRGAADLLIENDDACDAGAPMDALTPQH